MTLGGVSKMSNWEDAEVEIRTDMAVIKEVQDYLKRHTLALFGMFFGLVIAGTVGAFSTWQSVYDSKEMIKKYQDDIDSFSISIENNMKILSDMKNKSKDVRNELDKIIISASITQDDMKETSSILNVTINQIEDVVNILSKKVVNSSNYSNEIKTLRKSIEELKSRKTYIERIAVQKGAVFRALDSVVGQIYAHNGTTWSLNLAKGNEYVLPLLGGVKVCVSNGEKVEVLMNGSVLKYVPWKGTGQDCVFIDEIM